MNGFERIGDFFTWLGEVWAALAPAPPPTRALGLSGDEPALMRWTGAGYGVERPAGTGDAAPLLLGVDEALTLRITVPEAAALHGAEPARLEAARRCPFPLDETEWALARAPERWESGAPWLFAAARKARLAQARAQIEAAGARPGAPFAMTGGAPLPLVRRSSRLAAAALVFAFIAAIVAALSAPLAAARIETAAEARLSAARADLGRAEAEANGAAKRRDEAAAPLRAARAASALLQAAPPAAALLERIADATPDDAYAARLSIRPDRVEGEFAAPDAAALAATLGAAPGFTSARMRGAARAEGALQRATIELLPAPLASRSE